MGSIMTKLNILVCVACVLAFTGGTASAQGFFGPGLSCGSANCAGQRGELGPTRAKPQWHTYTTPTPNSRAVAVASCIARAPTTTIANTCYQRRAKGQRQ
jgi:hypothetical protein